MAKVCQLFSGSSGNSILVSSSGHNYLVDIGVSAKKCENGLNQIGVERAALRHIRHSRARGPRKRRQSFCKQIQNSGLCLQALL